MRVDAFFGRDWTELGAVASRRATHGPIAIALSRGRHPKGYHAVDPNEDVVAAVELEDGRHVLVCADGHNGEAASRLAVETVLARAESLRSPGALLDAFAAANDAVLATATHPRNRTTLIVVVLGHREVHWAAMGDSALVHLPADGPPERLGDPRMHFVGFPMTREELDARVTRGTVARGDDDTWVLVTDGLEEFLPPGTPVEDEVARVAAAADTPLALAEGLVEAAFDAGAGDNVAAAVMRGASERPALRVFRQAEFGFNHEDDEGTTRFVVAPMRSARRRA